MSESVENLVLEHLRFIRGEIASVKADTREIKSRLAVVESGIAGLRRDGADVATTQAAQHLAYDRLSERVEWLEQPLNLVD